MNKIIITLLMVELLETRKVGRVEPVSPIHSENSGVRTVNREASYGNASNSVNVLHKLFFRKQFSGNLSTFLTIIIQVIFSHELLSEVERAYY